MLKFFINHYLIKISTNQMKTVNSNPQALQTADCLDIFIYSSEHPGLQDIPCFVHLQAPYWRSSEYRYCSNSSKTPA